MNQVAELLVPGRAYSDRDTVASAHDALRRGTTVFLRARGGWEAIEPRAAVGHAATRRLIDLHRVPVAAIGLRTEMSEVKRYFARGMPALAVIEGGVFLGGLERPDIDRSHSGSRGGDDHATPSAVARAFENSETTGMRAVLNALRVLAGGSHGWAWVYEGSRTSLVAHDGIAPSGLDVVRYLEGPALHVVQVPGDCCVIVLRTRSVTEDPQEPGGVWATWLGRNPRLPRVAADRLLELAEVAGSFLSMRRRDGPQPLVSKIIRPTLRHALTIAFGGVSTAAHIDRSPAPKRQGDRRADHLSAAEHALEASRTLIEMMEPEDPAALGVALDEIIDEMVPVLQLVLQRDSSLASQSSHERALQVPNHRALERALLYVFALADSRDAKIELSTGQDGRGSWLSISGLRLPELSAGQSSSLRAELALAGATLELADQRDGIEIYWSAGNDG